MTAYIRTNCSLLLCLADSALYLVLEICAVPHTAGRFDREFSSESYHENKLNWKILPLTVTLFLCRRHTYPDTDTPETVTTRSMHRNLGVPDPDLMWECVSEKN